MRRAGRMGGGVAVAAVALILGVAPAATAAVDPPDPGSTKTVAFGDYSYIVYVPTTYDRSSPMPLVVMTHGCQTTAEEQLHATLYNQVAEREGFIVLYPDVTPEHVSRPGPLTKCWFFYEDDSFHRDSGDAGAIAGMTRAVMDRWSVDSERVYMVGISAGGFMTSIMAAAYPDLFAAVGVVAASSYADSGCIFTGTGMPVEMSAQRAFEEMGSRARVVPRIVMGGDADQGIPPACADKALDQGLRTNNLVLGGTQDGPISLSAASSREVRTKGGYDTTVSTYLDPAGCLIGERWLIHGMNHFWPGGTTDTEFANFNDPKGPDGAEATWNFVSRYTMSSTANACTQAKVCKAKWLKLRLKKGAENVRATVNGTRAKVRVSRRHVRVRLSAEIRTSTEVVVRGRTADGGHFASKHSYRGCG